MVITGSKIDCLGLGGKENVEQSWRNLEITTFSAQKWAIMFENRKVHVHHRPYGRFYFVGLHKTRHGKKLQRPEMSL